MGLPLLKADFYYYMVYILQLYGFARNKPGLNNRMYYFEGNNWFCKDLYK
jgi:hypothetical protein